MRLAVVDTPAAVDWGREAGFDLIASDNPLLAATSLTPVINAEAAITQEEANVLGRAAIAFADTLDRTLRDGSALEALGLPARHLCLGGVSSRVAAALFHRGLAGARLQAAHGPQTIGLGLVDQPFLSPDGMTVSRLHNPLATLAKAGFFDGCAVEERLFPSPAAVRRESDVPAGALRRFAHLPLGLLVLEAVSRLRLPLPTHRGEVLILGENESLRETLPWLALSGIGLKRFGKLRGIETSAVAPIPLPQEVTQVIEAYAGGLTVFNAGQQRALQAVLEDWLAQALGRIAADWPVLRGKIQDKLGPRGNAVVLTNGLFGPRGGLIYAALKETGATVVDFEHGVTTGLSGHTQTKINWSEAATCDALLCCSDVAVQGFRATRKAPVSRIAAVGLADQTRRLFRPALQRRLARRALGIGKGETVVLHVNTWPYFGNMRPGYGAPTETLITEHERLLLEAVYSAVPHRVVYKPYPTERFAHQPPIEARLRLTPNIRISPPEDLRYVRAAADVIVTSTPTSTLGWVVGAGVPVVWLASRQVFPLCDEPLEAEIESAFLTVDIDRDGWPERLAALVARPLAEIVAEWDKNRALREAFYVRAVTGPKGSSGRRAARVISSILASIQTGS